MKCKCVTELEQRAAEELARQCGAEVTDVQMQKTFGIVANNVDIITCSTLTYQRADRKREQKTKVMHKFCPFCGTATVEDPQP